MPKKSSDKPAAEKSTVKKASKKSAGTELKAVKKAAKSAEVVEVKPKSAKKTAADKPKAQKSASKPKKSGASIAPEQLEEHIRVAAYYRWEERGRNEGLHEEDWLEAERQVQK
jgi:hypothetical protein